ncbi:IS110 family transposase [Stenotrophomonas sp. NLF4-10]|nr:IS110 family transposase [Stenotrophomonas sp. NLF4-10]MCG8276309.1 IS110 family transposase [Stenotrophomonas sp. NLF4-10]
MQVIGIDVAKATFDIALPLGQGKYRTRGKLGNTAAGWEQLLAWRQAHAPEAAVGMEATGIYHEALAERLVAAGVTVYVVNPAQIKAYGQSELLRTKTDRTDAKLIARFLQSRLQEPDRLHPYVPPTPVERTLRALVRRRDELKQMRQMELNRLESTHAALAASIGQVVATLEQQITQIEKAINEHIDNDPDLRGRRDLLTTIPGISGTTSAFLLACLGELNQYSDVGQIVAHAGLNPARRQSGTHEGKVRISRVGNATLRAKLYMPALVGKRHNPVLAAFAQRLAERGKPPKLILCALMRKLLHIVWGVLKSATPFDPRKAIAHA